MLQKIKQYFKWIVLAIILGLAITCVVQCNTNRNLRHKYEVESANTKALLNDKDSEIIALQLSLDVLRHTNDSTIQNLLKQQEKLNIKNKELQTMISMASQFHVHDTLRLHDTIFKEPTFWMDTCFKDQWRTTCLDMRYPGDICVDATMVSKKEVYVTAKRETIEPPHWFFLCRWFQKKHTVTRVIINEENPYIENQENVYIRVVDD